MLGHGIGRELNWQTIPGLQSWYASPISPSGQGLPIKPGWHLRHGQTAGKEERAQRKSGWAAAEAWENASLFVCFWFPTWRTALKRSTEKALFRKEAEGWKGCRRVKQKTHHQDAALWEPSPGVLVVRVQRSPHCGRGLIPSQGTWRLCVQCLGIRADVWFLPIFALPKSMCGGTKEWAKKIKCDGNCDCVSLSLSLNIPRNGGLGPHSMH